MERRDPIREPVTELGAPGVSAAVNTREKFSIGTAYIRHDDSLKAQDLQGLPMYGSEMFYEQFDVKLMEKMAAASSKFDQTAEYHRWRALFGDVYDADGVTKLWNSFEQFGEEQFTVDYKFDQENDGAMAAAKTMRRYMEQELRGETMRGQIVFCSSEFMDRLTQHPSFQKFYENQNGHTGRNPLINDVGATGFTHGDVTYVEFNGVMTYVDGRTGAEYEHRLIPAGEAIAIPLGTQDTFCSFFAPGTMMDSVNQPGERLYSAMEPMKFNQGLELMFEQAPLHIMKRPRLAILCKDSTWSPGQGG